MGFSGAPASKMGVDMPGKRDTFTLIELLIVFAIIAILAAIAILRFLEAQVRSKVRRIQADQRTVATVLEVYSVDYNRYPQQKPFSAVWWCGGWCIPKSV